ncbi:pyridoxal phosphate-dependent aminotransferase [Aeromicrobium chenweiae]|uniref:Putative succinyldiaminopimelate transaminase DapC n=1 Tax=Aeromicrobium chenweiae TaxID=2079793 RepID=A0A2S0WI81_9ACTN|nr:pyridoxal phosphate-dependent aminotransferase [Aeromicrobium chenweiae]AWB91033.1 putative succinyldiaminopimelate transaminase DapC [Aeromicrobium chenweiae]TGN31937.1 putative succinyldiaminopimelate transaminase DapC [Aeromicrobium chenweiae]
MKTSSSRIAGLGTTIFAEMSALAARTGAVNLGQGFPDTDGPDDVVDRAVQALRGGRNQYAPGTGVPELRSAIAAHQQRFYGLAVDPDTEVAVTTGATEAVAAALLGLVDPGDEVIALEPYYDSYVAVLQMSGAVRRPVTLRAPDFRLPIDELRAAVTPRTTAILLNTPHNPTGSVLRRDELEAVAAIAIEHDLVVITDEVYEHLTFDGLPHIPIATLPGMAERTLTISSAGKTFSFTGWKIGWATGPAPLVRAMLGAKQFLTYTSGSPLQPAIAHALGADDAYFTDLSTRLQSQRDLLSDGLRQVGFEVFVPEGTYFVTTDIRPLGFEDGLDFCRRLPDRVGVAAIPHQVFYDPATPADGPDNPGRPLVRWAFCKRPEVLREAVDRLGALVPRA